MKKFVSFAATGLFTFAAYAFAEDTTCSVVNKRGQQWNFTAATQDMAMEMSKKACDKHSINPNNCNPVCYSKSSQYYTCIVAAKKGQHWKFKASTEDTAMQLAKNACDAASINAENCKPACTPPKA